METPYLDPYLFERQFEAFVAFVQRKSGFDFVSLASNPYVEQEEGYKYEVYQLGRKALAFQNWSRSDVGTGKIVDATIRAIELDNNNLVPWQARYGEAARPQQPLYESKGSSDHLSAIEQCLYNLYQHRDFEIIITNLYGVGRKNLEAGSARVRGARGRWDEDSFFRDAERRLSDGDLSCVRRVYAWSQKHADSLGWGTGAIIGAFNPKFNHIHARPIYGVRSDGRIDLSFKWLRDADAGRLYAQRFGEEIKRLGVFDLPNNFV